MEVYNAELKVKRLDFNLELLKSNPVMDVSIEITTQIYPASDGKKDMCKYGFRIASHLIDRKTKKEAVGYLSEYLSVFAIENILIDFIAVRKYVQNAFMNHQVYIDENKPNGLNLSNIIVNPNIDGYTEGIIAHLKKEGYYP